MIVIPSLISSRTFKNESKKIDKNKSINKCIADISKWYQQMNSIVFGPGLGRDIIVSEFLVDLLEKTDKNFLIFDADFF